MSQPGGYGGAILDYGYLDAMWDLSGASGGYAADDMTEFQNTYLPQTYGTIATFNSDNGTSYSAFSQVPAAARARPCSACSRRSGRGACSRPTGS